MGRPSRFSPEVRERAVRPVMEQRPAHPSAWAALQMPVATIFENLEAGASLDDILGWYDGLDRKQVQAVIEFAARSLDLTATGR